MLPQDVIFLPHDHGLYGKTYEIKYCLGASFYCANRLGTTKMLHFKTRQSKIKKLQEARRATLEQLAFIRQFRKDEDGGLIILTLLLLISMLVVGGMAVDFMRFESERTKLQSVSDRAVLAAASLNQDRDPETVITDFFQAEGYAGTIIGDPQIQKTDFGSTITLDSEIDVNTFYLRLIGMDTLTAPATASAIEGTGNVEVSLILDISGSMRNQVTETITDENGVQSSVTASKMWFLQRAAKQFIDDLLLPEYEDRISVNLIAYSQQVSLGDELYLALKTTPDSISEDNIIGSSYGIIEDGYAVPFEWQSTADNGSITDNWDSDGNIITDPNALDWALGRPVYTNPARCVDFEPEEFETLTFDTDRVYTQVEYFEHYSSSDAGIDYPVCPEKDFEGIVLLSQDAELLKARIDDYRPTSFTSIHLGLKWGVSLLDPSMRDLLAGIPTIDPAFSGQRPSDYGGRNTAKYVVLMTDGQNVSAPRLQRNNVNDYYGTYEWRKLWSTEPFNYWRANTSGEPGYWTMVEEPYSAGTFNTWMQQLCDLAAFNPDTGMPQMTEVYTIAMGAGTNGTQQMQQCASKPANAFSTSFTNSPDEPGIDEIFGAIAQQITALRLSL